MGKRAKRGTKNISGASGFEVILIAIFCILFLMIIITFIYHGNLNYNTLLTLDRNVSLSGLAVMRTDIEENAQMGIYSLDGGLTVVGRNGKFIAYREGLDGEEAGYNEMVYDGYHRNETADGDENPASRSNTTGYITNTVEAASVAVGIGGTDLGAANSSSWYEKIPGAVEEFLEYFRVNMGLKDKDGFDLLTYGELGTDEKEFAGSLSSIVSLQIISLAIVDEFPVPFGDVYDGNVTIDETPFNRGIIDGNENIMGWSDNDTDHDGEIDLSERRLDVRNAWAKGFYYLGGIEYNRSDIPTGGSTYANEAGGNILAKYIGAIGSGTDRKMNKNMGRYKIDAVSSRAFSIPPELADMNVGLKIELGTGKTVFTAYEPCLAVRVLIGYKVGMGGEIAYVERTSVTSLKQ